MSKVRNWRLVTYLSEEQLMSVLLEHDTQIKAYAYILHDKDFLEDKITPKPAHYHLLLALNNAHTFEQVHKWFIGFEDDKGVEINSFLLELNHRKGAFAYLTHDTFKSKDKYQYPVSDIKSFNPNFFTNDDESASDCLSLAVDEILGGANLIEVKRKYGRDFIIHYPKIKLLVQDIVNQKLN